MILQFQSCFTMALEPLLKGGVTVETLMVTVSKIPDPGTESGYLQMAVTALEPSRATEPSGLRVYTTLREPRRVDALAQVVTDTLMRLSCGTDHASVLVRLAQGVLTRGGLKTNDKADCITLTHDLTADLGMDSLDRVEFIMEVETEYGINIDDEDERNLHTLEDVRLCVLKYQSK